MSEYSFRFRDRVLPMDGRGYVMGIVNVTPDSFSDGGLYASVDRAVEHGLTLVSEGASMLDIGGESTRPGHSPVAAEEEIRRVVPVLRELRRQTDVPLSIDTMKCSVASAALSAGADMVNDVTGFDREREEKCALVRRFGAGCILMHWRERPAAVSSEDYVDWVCRGLRSTVESSMALSGLSGDHFMTDPGIGFSKSDAENLALLGNLSRLRACGWPVLLGISRKSFLGRLLDKPSPLDREYGTASATALGAWQGVDVHRVHSVGAMVEVVRVARAIRESCLPGVSGGQS